jgi:predicted RNA binding protein YcfA (HicA-like mRNA interferase family)
MSGKELAAILVRKGWTLLRIKGSHHVFGKAGVRSRLSVPIHGNKALGTGLLQFLLKQSGLTEADLD